MTNLVIKNLDRRLQAELQSRADLHGRSIGDEARALLVAATRPTSSAAPPSETIGTIARRLFGPAHGLELSLPARSATQERDAPDFES